MELTLSSAQPDRRVNREINKNILRFISHYFSSGTFSGKNNADILPGRSVCLVRYLNSNP